MTCKDCIHYDVCGFEWCDSEALTFCKDFKDKSRIIELPCKIGDKIYNVKWWDDIPETKIINGKKYSRIVRKYKITKSKFTLYDLNWFGTKVFLTKEEAEAKLKELNENGDNNG